MYEIEMQQMSDAFLRCWRAARAHLNRQSDGGLMFWLRSHPYPPFLEHLSFRIGNQLFFVRVEDVGEQVRGPGSLRGLLAAARSAKGHACILPMRQRPLGESWAAALGGWGLIDATTRSPVDPLALVSDEKIEMTPWEIHGMAVQVMLDYLEKQRLQVMSWQADPAVDPAIWFIGETGRPEWLVVRATRYPNRRVERPDNWNEIAQCCARLGTTGHFASVALVSAEQPFRTLDEPAVPLWRGHAMHARMTGLE